MGRSRYEKIIFRGFATRFDGSAAKTCHHANDTASYTGYRLRRSRVVCGDAGPGVRPSPLQSKGPCVWVASSPLAYVAGVRKGREQGKPGARLSARAAHGKGANLPSPF